MRQGLGRNSGTRVPHCELNETVCSTHRDLNLSRKSKLEGIRKQVEYDLFPHLPINEDLLADFFRIDDEPQPGTLDRRAEEAGDLCCNIRQVDRLIARFSTPCFDPRKIKQRVH